MSGITTKATETLKSGAAAVGLGSNDTSNSTPGNSNDNTEKSKKPEESHNSWNGVPGDTAEREHGLDTNPDVHPEAGSAKAPEFLEGLGKGTESSSSDEPTES